MPTMKEPKCCMEYKQMQDKMVRAGMQGGCITSYPGFEHVCLNEWVLQLTYISYRQQYGARAVLPHSREEQYRHIAYRNLVRFCYGYLGRLNRVTLPACAVLKIRKAFPNPEEDGYSGFKLGKLEEI
ncbi:P2X purinoceptor 7-like [Anneissia japonica]|uniref:P2X purinoceptor 7-like n=1 Tax=Anneissia japonica TaxID=1529436 RepID=UPI00142565B4|nr:P2X purinoceptor 7-like [Anneissia japonica]